MDPHDRGQAKDDARRYLLALAHRNAAVYEALPGTRAIIVMGSVASGHCDQYSDLDMAVYHEDVPSEATLQTACRHNGGGERTLLGPRSDDGLVESYLVQGVECQFAHLRVAAWEEGMATVLDQHDVTSPLHKAISGLLEALPLSGAPLIREWQDRASRFPDALAQAMVEHYLVIPALWGIEQRLLTRDATLWLFQGLVEAEQQILGVLAGLNRQYYSTFQFKRLAHFVAQLAVAPPNLATRLDALFYVPPPQATAQLRGLVEETVALVEQHMPQVDTAQARQKLARHQHTWMAVTEGL